MPLVPLDVHIAGLGNPGAAGTEGAAGGTGAALARHTLAARVVYNGIGSPREDGAVVVLQAAGKASAYVPGSGGETLTVVELLDRNAAGARSGVAVGEAFAISPPPVNAHTHLDLSDMPLTPGDYVAFIRSVIAFAKGGGRGLQAAKQGLAEVKASGVNVVGDIVTDPAVMELLLEDADLQGVAYWEVIAPDPEDADAVFASTTELIARFRARERPGGVRVGLTPHTPHTVSQPLLSRLVAWARAEGLPVAIHVAESAGERQLHLRGDGPLAEALASAGFAFEVAGRGFAAGGVSPVRYLERIGVLQHAPTLIHMVHVDEDDVRLVQRHGCTVVHCPRSNDVLECGRFPWELYARHGVEVAFGTDSRGSSPDLDVTAEVRHAAALHGSAANLAALVRGAVKSGYRALGIRPPQVTRGEPASRLVVWR